MLYLFVEKGIFDMTSDIKTTIKDVLFRIPIAGNMFYGYLFCRKKNKALGNASPLRSERSFSKFYIQTGGKSKAEQIAKLFDKIDIAPVDSKSFFYSLDFYKAVEARGPVYGNNTADMSLLVNGDLRALYGNDCGGKGAFYAGQKMLVNALRSYLERCRKMPSVAARYEMQLDAAVSLFERPAKSFFEALQRILFYNQFLWQTGHTLNGLGHLDWILEKLYQHDIEAGFMTREGAKELIKDFFRCLHEYYWFKSAALMGDTGQIVILGGRDQSGQYHCNDLTYLFIEASEELRMPDPKVLLRCTADMPEDLLGAAVDCIATGIGAPLLSNDDAIIPAMLSCGYDEQDVYNYGTSACWEPLIPGISCEANNIASLNFALPFTDMLSAPEFSNAASVEEILNLYEKCLAGHIKDLLTPLTQFEFVEDPLLSLASPSCAERGQDITRGGAKYNSLGLTTVGLGTVVNSLLNIQKLVFAEKRYTLDQLDDLRRKNFAGQDDLLHEMKDLLPCFGCDDAQVTELTRRIISVTSGEFEKYRTKLGGRFKFGLSSPSYISGGQSISATFDGRRDGDPFSVHISSGVGIPTTELLSFAMKLDYNNNRLNGNVIDFITSPGMLKQNRGKYMAMLRAGFAGGIFQLQMNVVDSKTLIAAKADPTLFPNLVVRVWGFSAYFNDLPEEYKDVLIARAIENEKAA